MDFISEICVQKVDTYFFNVISINIWLMIHDVHLSNDYMNKHFLKSFIINGNIQYFEKVSRMQFLAALLCFKKLFFIH